MRAAGRSIRHLQEGLAALVLAAFLALPGVPAEAKEARLGVEFVASNFPNSTFDDLVNAMALSVAMGGYSSKIWHWSESDFLGDLQTMVPMMQQFGLKSVVQISPTFLGNPAPPTGYVKSFADPAVRSRFIQDVVAIARLKPDYLVLIAEANLMYRYNRAEFDQFRTLYQSAYNVVKIMSPKTKVGASWHHLLWYAQLYLEGKDVPSQLTPYDFIAFTTYPDSLIRDGIFDSVEDIPDTWFGSTRDAYPNKTIVFTETGWASIGTGGPEAQAAFVRSLPRLMSKAKPDFVIWSLLQDVSFFNRGLLSPADVAFLEGLGLDIDQLFAKFNGMGLLDGTGMAKPAWPEALNLDFLW